MKGLFCAAIALIILPPLRSHAAEPDTCLQCHEKKAKAGYIDRVVYEESVHNRFSCSRCHIDIRSFPHKKAIKVNCGICHFLGTEGAPKEKAYGYKMSVHGKAVKEGKENAPDCQTCHGSHYIFPSKEDRSSTHKLKVPLLCSGCHQKEFELYSKSIHGITLAKKKDIKAPACFDCHMEHSVPATTGKEWKLALIKECGTCHVRELETFRRTYHGKVSRLGYETAAKCSDCHGSHKILPASDKESTLSENYILYTCRECHPKATMQFTKFYAHPDEHDRTKYPVLYYTYIFMTLLLVGVFAFFLTHTALWAYRSLRERNKR